MAGNNYLTSEHQPYIAKNRRRFLVVYENNADAHKFTFLVSASSASAAIALTVEYIYTNQIHTSENEYYLIPSILTKRNKNVQINYTVN